MNGIDFWGEESKSGKIVHDQFLEVKSGKDEGRFEQEQDEFYCRVWEKYREIALREPDRVVVIEGDLGIEEVHEQIVEAVAMRMSEAHVAK